ncbi:MAG: hypothetical protein GWN62_34930 [Aliifodinibius sp.]|nr:hypothetical protein [Fodinibius sp.]
MFFQKSLFMNRYCLLLLTWLVISSASSFSASVENELNSAEISRGIILYEELCAKCHDRFEKTTKPQRSVNRLRSSIEHFPAMRNLDFLDNEELEAIAAALATVSL